MRRARFLVPALCLVTAAGCMCSLSELPLIGRLTGRGPGEVIEGETVVESPIIAAPNGFGDLPPPSGPPPSELAPPARVVPAAPPQPMAKPTPYNPTSHKG